LGSFDALRHSPELQQLVQVATLRDGAGIEDSGLGFFVCLFAGAIPSEKKTIALNQRDYQSCRAIVRHHSPDGGLLLDDAGHVEETS